MAAKSKSKSVRLSDEVYAYIEAYEGNGFNEKFENIILDAKQSEHKRQAELARLDERIQRQCQTLQDLEDKYYSLDNIVRQAFSIDNYIKRLNDTIANLLEDSG